MKYETPFGDLEVIQDEFDDYVVKHGDELNYFTFPCRSEALSFILAARWGSEKTLELINKNNIDMSNAK